MPDTKGITEKDFQTLVHSIDEKGNLTTIGTKAFELAKAYHKEKTSVSIGEIISFYNLNEDFLEMNDTTPLYEVLIKMNNQP